MLHIDREKCLGCGGCVDLCPAAAIRFVRDRAHIGELLCLACRTCVRVCPVKAPAEV
jgi:ferredoxin